MKYWLLEDGQKSGPHESFVLRDRIESGELKGEELCWYPNATSWMPLREVEAFDSYFTDTAEDLDLPPEIPQTVLKQAEQVREAVNKEKQKAPPIHMVRRFFARMHDITLYISLLFIVFQGRTLDMMLGESIWPFLAFGAGYVILDGLMTHLWGSSPGKWLLGVRVIDRDGQGLGLNQALIRSARVWILGFGMWAMWPLALIFSWFLARRFGYFLWDLPHRYRVLVKPFHGLRVVGYIVSLFVISTLMNVFLSPEVIDQIHQQSGFSEMLQNMQPPNQ